jgi:hypothetical protein
MSSASASCLLPAGRRFLHTAQHRSSSVLLLCLRAQLLYLWHCASSSASRLAGEHDKGMAAHVVQDDSEPMTQVRTEPSARPAAQGSKAQLMPATAGSVFH